MKNRYQRQAIIRFLFFLKGASTWSSCQQGNQWSTMTFDISFTQSSVLDQISFILKWEKVFRSMACLCLTSKLYNKKGHPWHLWQKWSFKKIPSNLSFPLPGVLLGRLLLMRNLNGKSSSLTRVLFKEVKTSGRKGCRCPMAKKFGAGTTTVEALSPPRKGNMFTSSPKAVLAVHSKSGIDVNSQPTTGNILSCFFFWNPIWSMGVGGWVVSTHKPLTDCSLHVHDFYLLLLRDHPSTEKSPPHYHELLPPD